MALGDVGGEVVREQRARAAEALEPPDRDGAAIHQRERIAVVAALRSAHGWVAGNERVRRGQRVDRLVEQPGLGHPVDEVAAAVAARHPWTRADREVDVPSGCRGGPPPPGSPTDRCRRRGLRRRGATPGCGTRPCAAERSPAAPHRVATTASAAGTRRWRRSPPARAPAPGSSRARSRLRATPGVPSPTRPRVPAPRTTPHRPRGSRSPRQAARMRPERDRRRRSRGAAAPSSACSGRSCPNAPSATCGRRGRVRGERARHHGRSGVCSPRARPGRRRRSRCRCSCAALFPRPLPTLRACPSGSARTGPRRSGRRRRARASPAA